MRLTACSARKSLVINSRGNATLRQGDLASAAAYFAEGLRISEELDSQRGIAESLDGLAAVALAQGQPTRAARLFGASEALLASVGAVLDLVDQIDHDDYAATARTQLESPKISCTTTTTGALVERWG